MCKQVGAAKHLRAELVQNFFRDLHTVIGSEHNNILGVEAGKGERCMV